MRKSFSVAAVLFAATFSLSSQVSYWFQGFQRQGDAAKARAYLGVTNLTATATNVWGTNIQGFAAGTNVNFFTNAGTLLISSSNAVVVAGSNATVTASTSGNTVTYTVSSTATGTNAALPDGVLTNFYTGTVILTNDPLNEFAGTFSGGLLGTATYATIARSLSFIGGGSVSSGGSGEITYDGIYHYFQGTNINVNCPVYSTSPSTNAPEHDEFVTAGWVRSLLIDGVIMYNSTNIGPGWVYGAAPYLFLTNIPYPFSRVYTGLTNNQYVGAVAITNITNFAGPFVVSAYLGTYGGSANAAITIHPEIYYSYDNGTNLLGDWESQAQPLDVTFGAGVTNRYDWVIPVPTQTLSGTATVYRVFRVTSVSGTPNKPNLVICGGTNTPGQVSFNINGAGGMMTVISTNTSAVAPGANVTVATNGNVYTVSASTGGASGVSNFGMRRVSFFEQDSYPAAFHASLGMTPSVVGNNYRLASSATEHGYSVFYVSTHNQCGVKDTYANFVPPNKSGLFRFVVAPTNTSNIRLWTGLVDDYAGTSIWSVQDPTTNRMAMFRLSTNSANWFFITCDGAAATSTDTGVPATTSRVMLDIQNTGASWIGTIGAVSVTNTTNLPDQPMCPLIHLFNTDANAAGCKIWGYYGEQEW